MLCIGAFELINLRNVVGNYSFIATIILNILVVFGDCIFTIEILIQISATNQDNTVSLIVFLAIYPLGTVISPLLGIMSLITCKKRMYQNLAYFNMVTLFLNSFVLFIIFAISTTSQSFGVIMIGALVISKFLLALLIP